MNRKFTEDDLDYCWLYYKQYFIQLLNNEYTLEEAREDLQSLIGTKYDPRSKEDENNNH